MSNQPDFTEQYRQSFLCLGHSLTDQDGVAEERIAAMELKLNLRLPKALRDYYLIAGAEKKFNHAFNRLWSPENWELHKDKLIFMVENQGVVAWGVSASVQPEDDPAVFQAAKAVKKRTLAEWHEENGHCAVFLNVMLHWQATFGGGLTHTSSATAPQDLDARLEDGWQFVGEDNKMRAFNRNGQAICILEWRDFFDKSSSLRIFAGASSQAGLNTIAKDLNLQWN